MMSGIVKVGTGAGQFLVPLIASALISACGWRNAYLIIGGFVLAALVIFAQIMKRDPRDIGMLPDGRQQGPEGGTSRTGGEGLSLRTAARTMQFWGICLSEFAVFFCFFTIIVHIVPHAMDMGIKPAIAASVISTIGGVSMLGRFIMGMANDKIGGKRSLIVCFIILISSIILLQFTDSTWMLFVFAFVYGFAHGGFFTVMSPTIAEFFGMDFHGQLFGTVLFIGTVGATIGPIMTGFIFDITGQYRIAFMVLTVFAVAGFLPVIFLRPLKRAVKS